MHESQFGLVAPVVHRLVQSDSQGAPAPQTHAISKKTCERPAAIGCAVTQQPLQLVASVQVMQLAPDWQGESAKSRTVGPASSGASSGQERSPAPD
jgi:hypothetical protein